MPVIQRKLPQKQQAPPSDGDNGDLFLLDIPTAARRMSTSVFAIRQLCRSGQLTYVVVGHKWLISLEAIRDFIRKREAAAKPGRSE